MNAGILIIGIIIAAISTLHLVFPRFCLRFGNVWKFEGDVEPTSEAIYITKFIAVIFLIIGALLALYECDDNKRIILEISRQNGSLEILMKNTIISTVLGSNPTLETSKADKENHGFGTKIIREIAEKNHGYVDFYEEDGMFCCLASVND